MVWGKVLLVVAPKLYPLKKNLNKLNFIIISIIYFPTDIDTRKKVYLQTEKIYSNHT